MVQCYFILFKVIYKYHQKLICVILSFFKVLKHFGKSIFVIYLPTVGINTDALNINVQLNSLSVDTSWTSNQDPGDELDSLNGPL